MRSVPPLFFSFFHRLNLEGKVCHFFACHFNVDGLVFFDVCEFEGVVKISDFFAFKVGGSWVLEVAKEFDSA